MENVILTGAALLIIATEIFYSKFSYKLLLLMFIVMVLFNNAVEAARM